MKRSGTVAPLIAASLLLFGLCYVQFSQADGTCGLRPPPEGEADAHPSDLNADGEVTPEEFAEYAKVIFPNFLLRLPSLTGDSMP